MGKKVTEENGVWELCPICENEVFILKMKYLYVQCAITK